MSGEAFKVCAIFDTETTDTGKVAFPYAYLVNDTRRCDMASYRFGDGSFRLFRYSWQFLDFIEDLIGWGIEHDVCPVVTAYNLAFDLQSIQFDLWKSHRNRIKVNARNSSNIYTLDIIASDKKSSLLRFWDCYHLETGGLARMGEICGVPKLVGDLDYSLPRAPETRIDRTEIAYMRHDVEIPPCYFRSILEMHDWATPDMLGSKIITRTSLVRQMARNEIGPLRIGKRDLKRSFQIECRRNVPKDFESYLLRKACFRGGLTFTASGFAFEDMPSTVSLDVVSMHHAFINQPTPTGFTRCEPSEIQRACELIAKSDSLEVLSHYAHPFPTCFHAAIRFKGIRPRARSAFERFGIQVLAREKFKKKTALWPDGSEAAVLVSDVARASGFKDSCVAGRFAFSKLETASECTVFLSEVEFAVVCMVYEFDSFEVLLGEVSQNLVSPPAFVSLQSSLLFERKQEMKQVIRDYQPGKPNARPRSLPDSLADEIERGESDPDELERYYRSSVKGPFNGIYGTQAQDVFKPGFAMDMGELAIEMDEVPSEANFEELRKSKSSSLVMFPYGLRIVGRSRHHLCLAVELIWRRFGERAKILGGDTDSLKISTDLEPEEILGALEPLHTAVRKAIEIGQRANRRNFPDLASGFEGVGTFEVEGEPDEHHMELWNKCRVSQDRGGKIRITCAGLSKGKGGWNCEDAVASLIDAGDDFHVAVEKVLGFNSEIDFSLSHTLAKSKPSAADFRSMEVIDRFGDSHTVECHEAVKLSQTSRELASLKSAVNLENLRKVERCGKRPIIAPRKVDAEEGMLKITWLIDEEEEKCPLRKN